MASRIFRVFASEISSTRLNRGDISSKISFFNDNNSFENDIVTLLGHPKKTTREQSSRVVFRIAS